MKTASVFFSDGTYTDGPEFCFYCGAPCSSEFSVKNYVKKSFNNRDLVCRPASDYVCGGRWNRKNIRVAELGDVHGNQFGRSEWELEYYSDLIRRLKAGVPLK